MARRVPTILIVGGGASGALMARHVWERAGAAAQVVAIAAEAGFGRGLAYSTPETGHLLNVRAEAMGGFPDAVGDFAEWLRATGRGDDPAAYVSRGTFGDYLVSLMRPPLAAGTLEVVRGLCVGLAEMPDGVTARLADGGEIAADFAVLATGNEAPPAGAAAESGWAHGAPPAPDAAVLIKGAGLTMVDRVISLAAAGHRGPVLVVSRRGLMPHPHAVPAAPPAALDPPLGLTASATLAWLRREIARVGDWRAAIDGLRPHSQAIWRAWSLAERRRFARHLRPYWDVHRHRAAPAALAAVERAVVAGRLRRIAAKIEDVRADAAGATVRLRRRGSAAAEVVAVDRVIDCTGAALDPARSSNPAIAALLKAGLARPDPSGLGLEVGDLGALVAADGRVSARLFALGPPARAGFWEITAIAEIRAQCAALAVRLTAAGSAAP